MMTFDSAIPFLGKAGAADSGRTPIGIHFARMFCDLRDGIRFQIAPPIGEMIDLDLSRARLPYENTCIHFIDNIAGWDSFICAKNYVNSAGQEGVSASVFEMRRSKEGDGAHQSNVCKFIILRNGGHDVIDGEALHTRQEVVTRCTSWLLFFLTLLNHPDQRLSDHEPSAKLNRRRAAKGKPPLVSYKTLTVMKPHVITGAASLGGTHASPKIHTRRGYFRHLRSGKEVWISPCIVGDKSQGIHLKDYKIVQSSPAVTSSWSYADDSEPFIMEPDGKIYNAELNSPDKWQ